MSKLQTGLAVFPYGSVREAVKLAQEAERLGMDQVWVGDSHLIWRDTYTTLGAIGASTSRVRLATGVTNPITRDVSVTASAMASLAELTGGRAALGMGVGDSAIETIGAKRATVAELERAVREVQSLCSGQVVKRGESDIRISWAPPETSVRVFVAAGGNSKATLRMAGRTADGVVVPANFTPDAVSRCWDEIRAGAAEVGRDLEGFEFVFWLATAIDEDGVEARNWAKPHVARRLNHKLTPDLLSILDEEGRKVAEAVRMQYDWHQHLAAGGHHEDLIPTSMVEKFALAGTPGECREQFQRLQQMWGDGVTQVAVVPYSSRPGGAAEVARLFMEEVLPTEVRQLA
jgi:5,10-methylenetetrahydromethanopterin reductase